MPPQQVMATLREFLAVLVASEPIGFQRRAVEVGGSICTSIFRSVCFGSIAGIPSCFLDPHLFVLWLYIA